MQVDQKIRKLESNVHALNEQSAALQAALQQRPENPTSNEQVALLADKLDVALTGLNHLVQHFHEENMMSSFCMKGLVGILKTKFTQQEIAAVMKQTIMDDYLQA